MDTASYIPSNHQFGFLQFECGYTAADLSFDISSLDNDVDPAAQIAAITDTEDNISDGVSLDLGGCWSSEPDMILGGGGAGAAGLGLEEPLPALFPYSSPPDGRQHGMGGHETGDPLPPGRGAAMVYKTESSPQASPDTDAACYRPFHSNASTITNSGSPPASADLYRHHHHHQQHHDPISSPTPCNHQQHTHNTTADSNTAFGHGNGDHNATEKVGEVAADVLLSLKHAVVHPGELPPQAMANVGSSAAGYYGGTGGELMEGGLFRVGISGFQSGQHHHHHHHHHQATPLFPSMSVNVSMNMTMHGYHHGGPSGNYCPTTAEINYPQVQWHQCAHHRAIQSPPPPYSTGATYSITADFRPSAPSTIDNNQQQQSTTGNNNTTFTLGGASIVAPMLLGTNNVNSGALGHHQLMAGGGATYKAAPGRPNRRDSTMSVGSGCYSEGEEGYT